MKRILLPLIIIFYYSFVIGQALPGSGNAVDLSNVTGVVEVQNTSQINFPITISAWVNTYNTTAGQCIFLSDANSSGYRGFWFQINGNLVIELGTGSDNCFQPQCRRSLRALIPPYYDNKWIHLTGVLYSPNNGEIYVNGNQMQLTYSGNGPLNMALSNNPKIVIGAYQRFNNYENFFDGKIDEIVVWNRALSQNEIREYMCKKVPVNAPNLVVYYKFDEPNASVPVIDSSPNGFNGTHVNGGSRVLSGAYIGDESSYDYSVNPNVQHINSVGDTVNIANTSTNIDGVQIYSVLESPNTYNGIGNDTTCIQNRYHGVYLSRSSAINPTADLSISGGNPPYGGVYWREANNDTLWEPVTVGQTTGNLINFPIDQNQELIVLEGSQSSYQSGLPATVKTCDFPFILSVNDYPGGTLSWSNGSTGKDVQIDSLGTYILYAYSNCDTSNYSDTVEFIQPNNYNVFDTSAQICQGDTFIIPGRIYTQTGFYSDTVVSSSSCDSIYNVDLLVLSIPQQNISESICAGQPYVLPGGDSVYTTNLYTDTLQSMDGCDSIVSIDLNVLPIYSDTLNVTICAFESHTLPDGNLVNENGIYISTLTNSLGCDSILVTLLSISRSSSYDTICLGESFILPGGDTVFSSGIYTDTFSTLGVCDSTLTTYLTTIDIQISIYADSVLCNGDSSGLASVIIDSFAFPPFEYQWSNNSNDSSITNLATGTYSITVSNAYDCFVFDSVEVFQPETLIVNASDDELISLGDFAELEVMLSEGGTPPYIFNWTPVHGLNDQSGTLVSASPDSTTSYIVTLTDANGCNVSDTVLIKVNPNLFIFPEGFTPNGDGHNDFYEILSNEGVEVLDFKVYNRWGELLHQDQIGSWDGKYKGNLQAMDNYIYRAKLKLPDGSEIETAGDFVLVK